jgi:ferredoxin-like protein FixX
MHRCAGGQVLKNAVKTTEDLYLLFERVFRAVSVEVNDSRSIDARGLIDRRISLIAQAPFTSRSTQKKGHLAVNYKTCIPCGRCASHERFPCRTPSGCGSGSVRRT